MSEFNMSDEELNGLLKERLLSGKESDAFLDAQAKVIFAGKAKIAPPLAKEKAMLSKLGAKTGAKIGMGWIFTSLSVATAVIVTSTVLILNAGGNHTSQKLSTTIAEGSVYNKAVTNSVILSSIDSLRNEPAKKVGSTIAKAVSSVSEMTSAKSVTTMEEVTSTAPVSTKTVTPAANLNIMSVTETKTATPSVPNGNVSENKTSSTPSPVVACKKPTSSCRLWKTKDFCATPDSMKFPYGIDCNNCEYSESCKEYDAKKLSAVILRVYKKSGLTLEKGFQNIHLIKADGKKSVPLAVNVDRFMHNVTKARVNFKNVVDIVLLFDNAEVGDTIIIDGVVEVVIEK